MSRRPANDRGSAPLLFIALCSVLSLSFGLLGVSTIAVRQADLQQRADRAALEVADTRNGRLPGDACSRAESVASAVGAEVVECTVTGLESRVRLRSHWGPFSLEARAHAGPPKTSLNLTSRRSAVW